MTLSSRHCWRCWTWIAISLHFLAILWLGLSRHWGYQTAINDLGVFDQAAWGTLHGQFLLNTGVFSQPINWLGVHFHPVVLLFVPLYAIAPCPEWFALAQALALSLAAWPIFLLASRILKSEPAGLLWATAYLVNPFLLNAAAWDFHPVALAVPFVASGFLAVERADSRLLLLSCLPLLLVQEHLGLTVAAFGILWLLRCKSRAPGVLAVLLGTAHAALVFGLVMPAFSPTGGHPMLASDLGQLSRYGWLGTALNHPLWAIQKVMLSMGGIPYLALLLLPFLGLPLAGGASLLPALPDLAANLLSANAMPRSIFAYHSALIVPVLTAAAIHGGGRISLRFKGEISFFALIACLATGYLFAPLPLPGAANLWAPRQFVNRPDPALPEVLSLVGGSASLSVQGNVGAHFSRRREIYAYPNMADKADYIVLQLESPTTNIMPHEPRDASVAWHLQMPVADYLASIACLLDEKRHGPALWNDPWLVLKRDAANPAADPSLDGRIRQKLGQLQAEWRVGAEEYREALQRCGKQKTP